MTVALIARNTFREATRDRVPLHWAVTQSNLGNALMRLGEREKHNELICDALGIHAAVWVWEVTSSPVSALASASSRNVQNTVNVMRKTSAAPQVEECLKRHEPILKRIELPTRLRAYAPLAHASGSWSRKPSRPDTGM